MHAQVKVSRIRKGGQEMSPRKSQAARQRAGASEPLGWGGAHAYSPQNRVHSGSLSCRSVHKSPVSGMRPTGTLRGRGHFPIKSRNLGSPGRISTQIQVWEPCNVMQSSTQSTSRLLSPRRRGRGLASDCVPVRANKPGGPHPRKEPLSEYSVQGVPL